jgi:hypothetical protein
MVSIIYVILDNQSIISNQINTNFSLSGNNTGKTSMKFLNDAISNSSYVLRSTNPNSQFHYMGDSKKVII